MRKPGSTCLRGQLKLASIRSGAFGAQPFWLFACLVFTFDGHIPTRVGKRTIGREMVRDVRVAVLAAKASEPTQKEAKRDVVAASSPKAPD